MVRRLWIYLVGYYSAFAGSNSLHVPVPVVEEKLVFKFSSGRYLLRALLVIDRPNEEVLPSDHFGEDPFDLGLDIGRHEGAEGA